LYHVINLPNLEIRIRKSDNTVWVNCRDLAYLAICPETYEFMLSNAKKSGKKQFSFVEGDDLFICGEGISLIVYRMGVRNHAWALNNFDDLVYAIEAFTDDTNSSRAFNALKVAVYDLNEKVKYFYSEHYNDKGELVLPLINKLSTVPIFGDRVASKEDIQDLVDDIIARKPVTEGHLAYVEYEEIRTLCVDIEGLEYYSWIESEFG
jgi:hypothetical protein